MVGFVWEWVVLGLRVSFVWVMRANALNPRGRMAWENQACRACTFDRPGLATVGAYPGCVCRAETYAIGIVLSLNSFVQKELYS